SIRSIPVVNSTATTPTQFDPYPLGLGPRYRDGYEEVFEVRGWTQNKIAIRDKNYESVADLLRVPSVMYEHKMVNTAVLFPVQSTANHLWDMTRLNLGFDSDLDLRGAWQDFALRSATLGFDDTDTALGNIT